MNVRRQNVNHPVLSADSEPQQPAQRRLVVFFSISVLFCAYLALKVKVISYVCKTLAVYTKRIV
jgi:hypothetical protein